MTECAAVSSPVLATPRCLFDSGTFAPGGIALLRPATMEQHHVPLVDMLWPLPGALFLDRLLM